MPGTESIQQDGPADLLPLVRYLDVLIEKYPKALTPKQLSKLSKVSLAAVSKMRDRLFPLCDVKWLASRRRSLLLRIDLDTLLRIGFTFYLDSRLGQFLRSVYAQTFLRKLVLDSHLNLTKLLPYYSAHFDEENALSLVGLGVRVVTDVLDQLPKATIRQLDSESLLTAIITQVIQSMDKIWPALSRQLKDPNTLKTVLEIRDKFWYLAQDISRLFLPKALEHILASLSDEKTRNDYLGVYVYTANFYLEEFLSQTITKKIREAAANANVPWNESYDKLGSTYIARGITHQGLPLYSTNRDVPNATTNAERAIVSSGAGIARGEKERRIELSSH
jgi:hypothetical protein